jgi:hypothetical protein
MRAFRLPNTAAPAEISELLFAAWVQFFASQRFRLTQYGTGNPADASTTYSYGSPTERNFAFDRSQSREWSLRSSTGIAEGDIEVIVRDSIHKLSSGDFGDELVYQTELEAKEFGISQVSMSNFFRLLGDQVPISGSRRLGSRVLLDFALEQPKEPGIPQLFVPRTTMKVAIFVPGPIASGLTDSIATGTVEVVAGICALALGRVVEWPLAIFPAAPQDAEEARARRSDTSILGLARDHVSLDIFDEFHALGGDDGLMRVRGALLSYHAALQQASPDVAMMLFITSMEALIVPRPEWRKDKATKRFIEALDQLCPDAVEATVNHANVEQAFGYRRRGGSRARHRQLLDQVYALRSNPTHSGIGLSGAGMMSMFAGAWSLRVGLLSDLARRALLNFLQAPRSSLIGHPMFNLPSGAMGERWQTGPLGASLGRGIGTVPYQTSSADSAAYGSAAPRQLACVRG